MDLQAPAPLTTAEGSDATVEAAPWLAAERPRLVRLCAHLTARPDAAEDLAQETLLEAWRNRSKLPADATGDDRARWLSAIARNVCLRWRRAHARAALATPFSGFGAPGDDGHPTIEDSLPGPADLELELERDELADLLDRALAQLPPAARTVLLQRFDEDLPHAEIAARLGVSEDVVAQRLRRGKLALRRLLTTELRDAAVAFDLALPAPSDWRETRIFCPFCGVRHLRCRLDPATGAAIYTCADGCALPSGMICGMEGAADVTGGLTNPKSILTRLLAGLGAHYGDVLAARETPRCPACDRPVAVYLEIPDDADVPQFIRDFHGLHLVCPACGPVDSATLWHLALDHPAALAFWRAHPRMRALPIREVEADGQPAFVTGFASADGSAHVEIVTARGSLRPLRVHHSP